MVQIKLPALFLFAAAAAITSVQVVALPVPPRQGSISPTHHTGNSSPSSSSPHLVPIRRTVSPVSSHHSGNSQTETPKQVVKKKSFLGRVWEKIKRPKTPPPALPQSHHTNTLAAAHSTSNLNEPKRSHTSPTTAAGHNSQHNLNEPQRGNSAPPQLKPLRRGEKGSVAPVPTQKMKLVDLPK